MFDWPEDVLEHARRRELVLVIGAGVSQNAQPIASRRPPGWRDLLKELASRIGDPELDVELEELFSQERYLDAAELLRQHARAKSQEQAVHTQLRRSVDGHPPNVFTGGEWHEQIVRLEPRVIITTNFDKILERATNDGYASHSFDSPTVASDVRRGEPVLLKMHGTVDHIERVVLSRRDYTRLRVDGRPMLEVIQALFLTRVALFIGYSLRDPDMQLLLENNFGGTDGPPAHYVLLGDNLPDFEREVLRFSYGVTPVLYPAGDHDQALGMLRVLADEVEAARPEIA
ncbi:SIR2 family protein [Cellulosimicrobium sp. AB352]|uniref:SIR2 family protein n=1 Tax=Cellulosimicrobium sp. AB352 TaxID=3413281 RepID=UPI003C29344D